MSKREEILSSILLKLKTIPGVLAANCVRSRVHPADEKALPAITVKPISDQENEVAFGLFRDALVVEVNVSAAGVVADTVVDPLVSAVRTKLMEDRTLAGLVQDIVPQQVKFEFFPANRPICEAFYTFLITYDQ